jgi:hypothetical protein
MESFCLPPPFNMPDGKDAVKLLLKGDIIVTTPATELQGHLQIKTCMQTPPSSPSPPRPAEKNSSGTGPPL